MSNDEEKKYTQIGEWIGEHLSVVIEDLYDQAVNLAKQSLTMLVTALPAMMLWNFVVPVVSGAPMIGYGQSLAMVVLFRLLTSRPEIEIIPALSPAEIELLRSGMEDDGEGRLRLVKNDDEE